MAFARKTDNLRLTVTCGHPLSNYRVHQYIRKRRYTQRPPIIELIAIRFSHPKEIAPVWII